MTTPSDACRTALPSLFPLALALALLAATGAMAGGSPAPKPALPIEITPQVRALLDAGGEQGALVDRFLDYTSALVNDVDGLDGIVAPDVQLHDIGRLGFEGLEGLKAFRRQRNSELPYDRTVVQEIRFPAPGVIEAKTCTERTDAAGARHTLLIHVWNRWAGGLLRERRDRPEELPPGKGCGPAEARP